MAAVAAITLATGAVAGPFEEATVTYGNKDYATALRLWRSLADAGDARAQNELGGMFEFGLAVPRDYAIAASWYRKAAEEGNGDAQFRLGFLYDIGRGVPQDYAMAVSWYRKAAEQGNAKGQHHLGSMYSRGQGGVPENYVLAHMWLNLAATQNDACAATSRDMLASMMSPAQIAEAQKLAREWKPKTKR